MEALRLSKTLVSTYNSTWHYNQEDGDNFTAMTASDLTVHRQSFLVSKHHVTEIYRRHGSKIECILDISNRWDEMVINHLTKTLKAEYCGGVRRRPLIC
jgi:hypothetical protein